MFFKLSVVLLFLGAALAEGTGKRVLHSYRAANDLQGTCLGIEVHYLANKQNRCHQVKRESCVQHAVLRNDPNTHIHIYSRPLVIKEDTEASFTDLYLEVFARSSKHADQFIADTCHTFTSTEGVATDDDKVFRFSISGPSENRVDVVFMGDGYTSDQQPLFLSDMERLVRDIFVTQTYYTWLPLYNIWSVFRPSVDSGIGYYGAPKNTSYKLYRDGTELRGVYPGDGDAIQSSCSATGPNGCDYPTCIGNDPFYGGLGGQFSISTASNRSGIVVLRHEFGHSMGNVGEEYDSGSHFGANSARNLDNVQTKWGAWLTQDLVREDSIDLVQDYAWFILQNDTTQQDYVVKFTSTGEYDRWYLLFSMSGCESDGVVTITLDDQPLDWHSCDSLDRCFYGFYSTDPLTKGDHTLVWHSNSAPNNIFPRQLCSISMLEYKNAPDFHFDNSWISAYPTYSDSTNFRAYRPSNERCIMRNMSSAEFCSPDKENLWLKLVGRVRLIDSLDVIQDDQSVTVTATVIPFGKFRDDPIDGEYYTAMWYHEGVLQPSLTDLFSWTKPISQSQGSWTLNLQLTTDDVRSDPNNALSDSNQFFIVPS